LIDGLRIDLTAEELVRHLDERIRHHHERAAECDRKAQRVENLESPSDDDEDEQMIACWPGFVHELERRAARHRNRETLLVFLRNHIVGHEIYRLSERDLKSVELLPADEEARSF
jgi:hypothetical protein